MKRILLFVICLPLFFHAFCLTPPTEDDKRYVWLWRQENWDWSDHFDKAEMVRITDFHENRYKEWSYITIDFESYQLLSIFPTTYNQMEWEEFNKYYRRTAVLIK